MKYIRFISVLLVIFAAWCAPASAAFILTDEGTPTGSATLTSSSFNPGAGGLVYVVIWDQFGSGTAPTDGTISYTAAGGNGASPIPDVYNTFYHYYASSPGAITVSYTTGIGSGAGMSVTLITGSSGVYDGTAGAVASGSATQPTVTSGTAAGSNELALASVGSGTSFTATQASGWSSPPNSFQVIQANTEIGSQSLTGTGGVTYNPVLSGGSFSGPWFAIVDLFEPAAAAATVHTLTLLGVGK